MDHPIHVIMKIKDQETYFKGESFPLYEIGWRFGADFYLWNGNKLKSEDILSVEVI